MGAGIPQRYGELAVFDEIAIALHHGELPVLAHAIAYQSIIAVHHQATVGLHVERIGPLRRLEVLAAHKKFIGGQRAGGEA
ncbi:hypothetical protein [Massilia sp. CCM 8734]|uniref:hypothetical protein n=1 Tax=Massilia sp. CCM 8734 TaxID=2609283 RepID=UPI0014213D59|nr:hypothetical protein [Massilia sp. CCM 8734]